MQRLTGGKPSLGPQGDPPGAGAPRKSRADAGFARRQGPRRKRDHDRPVSRRSSQGPHRQVRGQDLRLHSLRRGPRRDLQPAYDRSVRGGRCEGGAAHRGAPAFRAHDALSRCASGSGAFPDDLRPALRPLPARARPAARDGYRRPHGRLVLRRRAARRRARRRGARTTPRRRGRGSRRCRRRVEPPRGSAGIDRGGARARPAGAGAADRRWECPSPWTPREPR